MLKALITNIQATANNSKKKYISKEPYFDRKWGTDAAFNKTVDRDDYQTGSLDHAAEIYEEILVKYKTAKLDEKRNTFLSKMAVDSLGFIEEQRSRMVKAQVEETLCHNSMSTMMDHIFEILKSFSYELNNALGYGPLHVACTNPQSVTEVIKFNYLRQAEETVTYSRARLSTPSFSLVMRGDRKGIHFFIMPVARAIGLSKQECQFLPIARLSTVVENDTVGWVGENGRPLTPSQVEYICMNLFQRLIDETKREVLREEQQTPGAQQEAAS